MKFSFLTLFPELFPPILGSSLIGKAFSRGDATYELVQLRDFATDRHRTVDDTPYGGGAGMLLKVDILHAAWIHVGGQLRDPAEGCGRPAAKPSSGRRARTILMSPQGQPLTQAIAKRLVQEEHLIVVCGHYEGVDERFIELCVDEEVSIGDYVLTGGEIPAMVMADAIVRLIPGTVGNEESVSGDSLEDGLLKYPQYTRPAEFMGQSVPPILLSGDHGKIARWRKEQSMARTRKKRPDLLGDTDRS